MQSANVLWLPDGGMFNNKGRLVIKFIFTLSVLNLDEQGKEISLIFFSYQLWIRRLNTCIENFDFH